jgi:hypothetical protein
MIGMVKLSVPFAIMSGAAWAVLETLHRAR